MASLPNVVSVTALPWPRPFSR